MTRSPGCFSLLGGGRTRYTAWCTATVPDGDGLNPGCALQMTEERVATGQEDPFRARDKTPTDSGRISPQTSDMSQRSN